MTTGIRKIGDFCWINMLTPEPAKAQEFFAGLLGWTYGEIPGMGHLLLVEGQNMGAMFDVNAMNTPPGTPPHIGVMVKVESADAMVDKVISLGGQARPAFDIGTNGRMAVCFDPSGANVDVWQTKNEGGSTADSAKHGAPSWFECLTSDPAACRTFYTALFGWTAEAMTMPGFEYTVFQLGEARVAGLMALTPELGPKSYWNTVFTVDNADEAARKTLELGGTITSPLHDIPGVGRSCGIRSPQGVSFFVIQYLV